MAMGRAMDDEIIAAADAVAFTGVDGSTSTAYDTNMTVGVQIRWPNVTAANYGLNVAKLVAAAAKLATGNVDPDDEKWCIVNAAQVQSLLQDVRVVSRDYNMIQPLVTGQIVQYAGFNIISTERIGVDGSNNHKVLYWAKNGMKLALGRDIITKIAERPDKNHAMQVFAAMTVGSTRMEEARVGIITCDPTGGPGG